MISAPLGALQYDSVSISMSVNIYYKKASDNRRNNLFLSADGCIGALHIHDERIILKPVIDS